MSSTLTISIVGVGALENNGKTSLAGQSILLTLTSTISVAF